MKKVVIMLRVSSDEQAKGYSLDDQLERLTKYCERMGYQIVYVIREDHSAKSFDRPEFKKWFELVKSKQLKCDELLFTSWDRFSRDLTGALNMIKTLQKMGVTPQSAEQPIDYNIPENLFMLAIYLANPDVDNQRRSIKVKGGIRKGKKNGYWAQRPPLGYLSVPGTETKHIIVPDENNAWIIQYIFEQVAKGTPQNVIRKELSEKGVNVSRNNMCKILRKEVYMGKIVVPASEGEPAFMVEGKHEPLISEQLFYQVQNLLDGNKKKRKAAPKYNLMREDYHLRGILHCKECDLPMTASASRGKLGKRYSYYHCNNCKQQRESVESVHKAFMNLLNSIEISEDAKQMYATILDHQLGTSNQEIQQRKRVVQTKLEELQKRIEKMQDLLLDGQLSPEDFTSMRSRYSEQENELKAKIQAFKLENTQIKKYAESCLDFLANLRESFNRADVWLKQKIVGSIFDGNLIFDGKNCRTPQLNPVIALFSNYNADFAKKEKGLNDQFFIQSPSAVRGGFEPPVRLLVRQFSKLLVSATHPPHRI